MITDEILAAIAEDIGRGATHDQAAMNSGIKPETLDTFLKTHPDKRLVVQTAQSRFVCESLKVVAGGDSGWQGRAWIMERRHKAQFCRTPETTIKNTVQQSTTVSGIPEDVINDLAAIAARVYGPGPQTQRPPAEDQGSDPSSN